MYDLRWTALIYCIAAKLVRVQLTTHDDVIKWKHFPRYRPFLWGIHRSRWIPDPEGQWRGASMFTLICARINGWVNNREAVEWRRHRCHYDVIVRCLIYSCFKLRRQFHLLLVNFTYMGIVPVWPRYGIQLFASDTLAARYISYLLIGERRECLNSEYTSLTVPGKHIHHTMIIQIIGIFVLGKPYTQTRLLKSIHLNSFSARTSYLIQTSPMLVLMMFQWWALNIRISIYNLMMLNNDLKWHA